MVILKRIAPVVALLAMFFMAQPPAAQSMILKNNSATQTTQQIKIAKCNNKIVKWMYTAGFRGQSLRIGYAIIMRESGGNPKNITYNDWGLWQINRPTHPQYSGSALLDPIRSSRIAYKMTKGGKYWIPWGIGMTRSGKPYMDARDYDGIWNQWKKDNWIWIPFSRYYRSYPC
jgi:hypothetical protein